MKLKLLCALALLVGGKVLADEGLNVSKEIKTRIEKSFIQFLMFIQYLF